MFYKTMATLRHIVLAYTDAMRLEHYFRDADVWKFEALVARTSVLDLKTIGFQIGIEQVHFDLDF